jgi:hypothetical protein
MLMVNVESFRRDFGIPSDKIPQAVIVIDQEGVIRFRAEDGGENALRSAEFVQVMKKLIPEIDWE